MNEPIDKVPDPAERPQPANDARERELILRELAETIQNVFWMVSPDWKQVYYISPAYEILWGRTCESLYANPFSWLEAVLPEDQPVLRDLIQRHVQDDSVLDEALLYRIRRPDGGIRWIRARAFAIRDESQRICRVAGFAMDVTEQKHVEDTLQQRVAMEDLIARISSRLIRLTAAETDLGIQETLSELGTFIGVDRSYVFCFSDDTLSFTNTHEWCAPGITPQIQHLQNLPAERFGWFCRRICDREVIQIPRVADLPDEAAAEKAEFQREEILSLLCIPIVSSNLLIGFMGFDAVRGETTWSEDLIALLRIVGDNIAHVLVRKQHDQELQAYQQRLQSLASELSLTEERQRRQLANDLHENISQLLALMKIKLGMLKEKAARPDERLQIQEIRDLLENTLSYARNLTLDLSPPALYELGLKEALEWLIEQFRRQHQLKITYRVHQKKGAGDSRMEDDLRGLLYRCVRELLVNIAKHARAQRVDIRMELSDGRIAIQVQDDGIGMAPNRIDRKKTLQGGFGLFNIRERLAHFGGTVTIASAPKQGTTVIIRCPLQNGGP